MLRITVHVSFGNVLQQFILVDGKFARQKLLFFFPSPFGRTNEERLGNKILYRWELKGLVRECSCGRQRFHLSSACFLCKCGELQCTWASTMHGNPGVRKGAWTEEEDILLRKCIEKYGEGKWHQVPARAGLNRCRKSCRLRWLNYLRPDIKRGDFALDEVDLIIRLHKLLGNRWSLIAGRLPGRTANDVKNHWNTHLQKKMTTSRELEEGKTRKGSNTTTLGRASNIVKPRPWTFCKNASWLREQTTNAETTAQTEDGTIKDSSPTSQPNNMLWWDNVFLGEEGREGTTGSLDVGGSGEDNITTLWSNELSQVGVEEGGNWTHKNQDGSDYFSIYADLWDLISDQQAME